MVGHGRLDALLAEDDPAAAIRRARETGLLAELIPEIEPIFGFDQRNPAHDFDVGEHTLRVLAAMAERTSDPDLRLAALLHDIGKPESFWVDGDGKGHFYEHPDYPESRDHAKVGALIAERVMRRLGYARKRSDRVAELIRRHMFGFESERGARRFLERAGDERTAHDLLLLKEADDIGKRRGGVDPRVHRMRELVDRVLSEA